MAILLKLLLLGSPLLALASAPCPELCKGGKPAKAATSLKGYGPAESFCSSKYPVPKQTQTITASRSTVTKTVVSSTTTATVASTTVTETADEVTTTILTTSTPTTTEYTTVTTTSTTTIEGNGPKHKRYGWMDPRSSILKSLKSQAPSFVAAACTCLETPLTTTRTTTPLTTKRVAATKSVVKTIAVTTSTSTPITMVTDTIVADPVTLSSTSTVTTTTTICPRGCGQQR